MKNLMRRELLMLPAFGLVGTALNSALAQLVTGASKVKPDAGQLESRLEIDSSSAKLVDVFHWARSQAMAYALDEGDPVGPWYEAVEPGREGFCIRDTCHQAQGAHALGLARFNLNMLRRFANGLSFAAVLISMSMFRISELYPNIRAQRTAGGFMEGFRYVWSRPDLRAILIMLFLIGTLGLK